MNIADIKAWIEQNQDKAKLIGAFVVGFILGALVL